MALICENGTKECNGCGDCKDFGGEVGEFGRFICVICRREIINEQCYRDSFYEPLCIECLKSLHSL